MRYVATLVLTVPALLALGCKPDGPTRYSLSGSVTWNGKPVKDGSITFDPDTTKQADGPQGLAVIADGKYDTELDIGRGSIGGAMIVRIEVINVTNGRQEIVTRYKTTADVPFESSAMDFDIPASAAKAKPLNPDD